MMGNVAGVSQFLETAVLPGSQAATESTPSQNFAAVMQQTSNESGTPLPVPGSGSVEGQGEQGSSKAAVPSTQNVAFQATVVAEKDALAQLKNQIPLQGKSQGSTGGSVKAFASLASPGAKVATAVPSAAMEVVPHTTGETAQDVLAATPQAAAAAVAKGTAAVTALNAPATSSTDGEVPAQSLAAAAAAKVFPNAPAVQGAVVPQRVGKETLVVAGDQAAKPVPGKTVENKVDSALTTIVPQGTADVPQMDMAVAGTTVPTVAVPVMPEAMVSSGTATVPELRGALASDGAASAGVGPVSSARLGQGAAVPSSSLTQPTAAKNGLAMAPAASAPAAARVDAAPVAADAGQTWNFLAAASQPVMAETATAEAVPVQAAAAAGANGVGAALPKVAVGSASGAAVPVAPASPSQPAEVAGSALPEPMGTSVQGAITASAAAPALASTNVAAKPLLHGGRGGSAAGAAVTTATSGASVASAASQGVPSAAVAPVQGASAAAVPSVHAATATGGHSNAAASGPQAAVKSVAPAVSGVAAQQGAAQTKIAVADSSLTTTSSASVAARDFSDAAAPAAGQAAVALPATSGIVSTATVVVPASPLPHAMAGAGPGTTAAAGFVSGASESAGVAGGVTGGMTGGGSLPHTTLSATPTSLEVGVSSGTHGWLKIRAELNAAGEVNASLTGVNSAAATKLRGDLPALNSFLQDEKVQMGALDVRSALHTAGFESGSTFSQAGSGQGGAASANGAAVSADAGAAGNRAQQQAQQGAEQVPVLSESDEILPGRITDLVTYGNQTELGGSDGSSSVGYGAGGSWLNVRA